MPRTTKVVPLLPSPEPLDVWLPLSPSVNEAYNDVIRYKKNGQPYNQRVSSAALIAYKRTVAATLYKQGVQRGSWAHIAAVGYIATISVATRGSDLDNRIKALQDALCSYLGFNDNRVEDFHPRKQLDPAHTGIHLVLFVVEPCQPLSKVQRVRPTKKRSTC